MNKEVLKRIETKINKIKVINSKEEIYKINSNFLSLKKGTYTLNNNKQISRDTIVKNEGIGNAVIIISITINNKILVVIQPRCSLDTKDKASIELPAGYINNNEDIITSAKRELEEETGYKTDNIKLIDTYYPSLGASGEKIYLILATDCIKKGSLKLDSDEYIENEELSIEEFKYLIDNNYIKDASSRIAYYKILDYLNSK